MGNLFGFGAAKEKDDLMFEPPQRDETTYKVPVERANGRPHELGWLDLLNDDKKERMIMGNIPPGQIIMED
jgi:hypothetical protein